MRTPRRVHPGYPHHVMLRGNNRRRLFSYSSDYKRFLWDVQRGLGRCPVTLQALVLMSNHVHLVLTPDDGQALGVFVKFVAQRYAIFRNRRRRASGKLFEERFRSEPILTEPYCASVLPYIELNPVRAGRVAHPADYRWSTYRLHLGETESSTIPADIWTPAQWYRDLSADPGVRAQRYADWVVACNEHRLRSAHVDAIWQTEARSMEKYSARLERPDRKRAL